ncbi:AarF/ABC1/UbiB kinase family protein [Candidatus Saccharibacteria bacterium]|nr:AarF/ABC1/UbiB kinase family protein [Candidatus Saccharibacteria bacterium]NIW80871.1 AarF/ABC1/UbiB kinase family protein [Calditrichia bacterium]
MAAQKADPDDLTATKDTELYRQDKFTYTSENKFGKNQVAINSSYRGVTGRFFLLLMHVIGLIIGAYVASAKALPSHKKRWFRSPFKRLSAFVLQVCIKKKLRKQPFEVQLRRRLEMLGPTYIKLGQIMAVREDILPQTTTHELKGLLDQLPPVPYSHIRPIIEGSLSASVRELFLDFQEEPMASASIGQTHRATTQRGKPVVVKVIKPNIRKTVNSDLKLLQIFSTLLEWMLPHYQPKMIINEFCNYTEKELDLTYEADHAELFAANFAANSNIVFPRIYRELSSRDVLCMEFFDGIKPNNPDIFKYSKRSQRKIIDLGAGAIIKMLYEDGFFHADLHAGNLVVLPGPKIGFIDLGMVGRFDERMKRSLLYYFYALVNGDFEGTTKHLLSMARIGEGGDTVGFKRAVSDLFRRYLLLSKNGRISLAQLILTSLKIGGKYKIFFPVEMTLMVKALITYEGVGRYLNPRLNVPALSRKHIRHVYDKHFSMEYLFDEFMRGVPQLVDVVVHLPELIADSSRFWSETVNESPQPNPFQGIKSSLVAGACIIGGVIALVQEANPIIWIILFLAALLFYFLGK